MALTTNTTVWKFMALITLIITAAFAVCFLFENIFITFILGIVLIILVEACMHLYRRHVSFFQMPKRLETIFGWFTVIVVGIAVVNLMGDSFSEVVGVIGQTSPQDIQLTSIYTNDIKPHLPEIISHSIINEDFIQKVIAKSFSLISNMISRVSFIIANGILIVPLLFAMYYKRRERLTATILEAIPTKFLSGFKRAAKDIIEQLYGFLKGKVIESVAIAVICAIGFFIAGLKGWLVLSMFAGLLNIVPYIGPIIGAIPPLIIALLQDSSVAIGVAITVLIAQLIDNLYLIPFMISSKVHMDPLLSIILILVGAQLLGVMGMIFALPVYLVYKTILKATYIELVKIFK